MNLENAFQNHKILGLASYFRSAGFELYIVGGAVRDAIMGKEPHDIDFATDATVDEMKSIFKHYISTGEKHGTLTIPLHGEMFEVTTYRLDGNYSDGRHPDSVEFLRDIEKDLSRRDFTINAMAYDPVRKIIRDPFMGMVDINDKVIEAVGDPKERFNEDALRMLRAIRFSAQLGFEIEHKTFEAICECADKIFRVSEERVADEINKMLMTNNPSEAFRTLHLTGLLERIIPKLYLCCKQEQLGYHKHFVFEHTMLVLDYFAQQNQPLYMRLAALFHDVGKPQVAVYNAISKRYNFFDHEENSANITLQWLDQYKYSNDIINKVTHLVRHHMEFHRYSSIWSDAGVRRMIVKLGEKNLKDFSEFHLADIYGTGRDEEDCAEDIDKHDELEKRVEEVLKVKPPLHIQKMAINGHDLIALGIKPSKKMGDILNKLFEEVLENPKLNDKIMLLNRAKELL